MTGSDNLLLSAILSSLKCDPVLDMIHKLGMPSSERGLGAVELRKLPVKRFAPKGVHGRGVNRIQIGCGCCLVGVICRELRPSHGRILRRLECKCGPHWQGLLLPVQLMLSCVFPSVLCLLFALGLPSSEVQVDR